MSSYRVLLLAAVVFLTLAGIAVTTHARTPLVTTPLMTPDAPPGVKPDMWQRLSPKVGIAVQVERGEGGIRQFHGTLMFKDGDNWRPVILKEPSGVVPAR